MPGFFKIAFVYSWDVFILLYLKDILNQEPNALQVFWKHTHNTCKTECMCKSLTFVSKKLKLRDNNVDKWII